MRRTKAQQRQDTTHALVTEARTLFARHGYAAVSLADIVDGVGLTKGALYHHFDNKAALFHAVVEQVQSEVAARVVAAAETSDDPWLRLTAGCEAFLRASADPDVQQIMLVDGPAILRWHEWRTMDEAASGQHLSEALAELIEQGTIPEQPIAPLTHLLSGAMNEAALWLAQSTRPRDLDDTIVALSRLLDSLRHPKLT
ncbi:TetR family transcriptional regulator [Haloactinopolyspora alba]|uniref:TetR family transcriptional regulator n=1 Tax=Haloactinopolyspora alba TaxID=648780 RepID=A0A2P8EFQ3_9ACTN|nr:TetR/AcrR family transcriptional regulator [Haloactinopolyspora alba]PSL08280.1 TetR family transcriptional regulator [Haloactinopolyspora alba]